jgi:molybdopterin-containing oxidoreductase family iron-sulfur binding subunit
MQFDAHRDAVVYDGIRDLTQRCRVRTHLTRLDGSYPTVEPAVLLQQLPSLRGGRPTAQLPLHRSDPAMEARHDRSGRVTRSRCRAALSHRRRDTTLLLAPGVSLITHAAGRCDGRREFEGALGLLIDTNRCIAPARPVMACRPPTAGRISPPTDPQWIRKVTLSDPASGTTRRCRDVSALCRAPCVDVCPTGASMKRADGIVLVDRHTCIGCRYCMMACPYKARSFVHEPVRDQRPEVPRGRGCVESCTLCVHRLDRGGTPACVEACAAAGHQALLFGDLNDPTSALAQRVAREASAPLRADLQLAPAVRYQGL